MRFTGCRGDCWQGRTECQSPGQCYAEAATDIGQDDPVEGRGAIVWPFAVCGVVLAVAGLWRLFEWARWAWQ
jgi:hypothetical protein